MYRVISIIYLIDEELEEKLGQLAVDGLFLVSIFSHKTIPYKLIKNVGFEVKHEVKCVFKNKNTNIELTEKQKEIQFYEKL